MPAPYLGTRALEVGAGIGTFTPQLAEGREVVAVEPDPAPAAQLRGSLWAVARRPAQLV